MFAVFDQNKKFISYSDQQFAGNFLFKYISPEKSDLLSWRWDGDYDTGKMVSVSVSGYEEPNTEEVFQNKYPLPLFFSVLLKQIYALAKVNNILDDTFGNMVKDFINCHETPEDYVDFLREIGKLKREKT
jgi:hypothetical protein